MAIPDPHAIPETEAACAEYADEADQAWDSGNSDHAYDLYYSLRQSQFATNDMYDRAAHRLGLVAQTRGDTDLAVQFLSASQAPGAAEALHALTNATTNDPTPSPDHVPESAEQVLAWMEAATQATNDSDWTRVYGLSVAASESTHAAPTQVGLCYYNAAIASDHLGEQDKAREYYEKAIPLMPDESLVTQIRDRLQQLGGAQTTATGTTPAEVQVAAGVTAYENGDATGAHTALQAALHLEGPDDQKGRAHYYLGAMEYQAGHYADARNHVDAAVASAPEPERGWAQSMLQWRWDEHPQPAASPNA